MPPGHGPDPADGRPEETDTPNPERNDELVALDTASATYSRAGLETEMGLETDAGLDTIAASGISERPALSEGEVIGNYRIEHELGVGGMGQVYAARRLTGPESESAVALKYLERDSAAMLYRFKQEFRTLAGVTHENLVSLGELVVLPDQVTFFTMELVDGVPFDEYVRGRTPIGELPNLARLRRALRQLVAGVRHLHQNGCIHRDLKPSNVLVTTEGRVVVLDFGLVQDASEIQLEDPDDQIMGTPAYMSPEQAGLERASAAADWYAVGVMLYECLCGQRPFLGNLTHLLFAKREFEAPEVSGFVRDVPPDLAALTRRLLARDIAERPSAREILAILDGRTDTGTGALEFDDDSMVRGRAPFVGRTREMAVLDRSLALVCGPERRQVTVHLSGPSGFGKTALVREFLARVQERDQVVVLKGRCLERESVPYKGIDPVVDALSVHLRQIPSAALAALMPAHALALARLFPVLEDLWRLDRSMRTGGLDAHELRQRAFEALRELLRGVALRRPLIVFIDDFHWGNVDSARLLSSLLRPPDAPPILVVVGYRTDGEPNEAIEALIEPEAVADRDVRNIEIGPLTSGEAHSLARALMGDEYDRDTAERYAAGSGGSPFYVGQLVHSPHGAGSEAATEGQLDQIVVRRIRQLDPASRRLLEVVAVAGGPVERKVAFAASELEDPAGLLRALREGELLIARGPDHGGTLETAHARIREVTIGELEPEDLRAIHLCLAHALELHASDPEALAEHFERGGERARAADYYERAAEQAANSLAFLRAVGLFRTTLELLPPDADPVRVADLRKGLADQLINVGRAHEAAQLLLSLAESCEAADPARARAYRRLAADQLIKTGRVDEGLVEMDTLVRSVGLRLPSGKAAAVSSLLWEQARMRIRGFAFERRDAALVPPELLDQIDTCFAVVNGLSTQEILLSALFHSRNLRLSLTAGEPYRVARALAYQCVVDVAGRDWRRVDDHMRVAKGLVAQLGDPQLAGFIDLCEASIHWFERRYPVSSELHTKVIESLEGVAGAAWDRRTAQAHHMWTLVCQGRLREFWVRAKGTTERARERGDMQEIVEVSAHMAVALVFAGKLDEAKRVLGAALDDWKPGRYLFGDVWAFYAQARILLHERQPEQAIELAENTLRQMRQTFLSEHLLARHNVMELLCRSYLSAAVERDDPGWGRKARKLAAKLRAVGNPVLAAQASVVEAGLATIAGDADAALQHWEEAARGFEAHGMRGKLAAVRARQAWVLGERGQGTVYADHAAGYFELEDIEDVDGFCRVIAPAHPRVRGG